MLKKMNLKIIVIMLAMIIVGTGICQAEDYNFKMMTGSAGGIWYPTGSAIAEILKDNIDNLNITVVPGAGNANMVALQNGQTDFAFGKSPTTVTAIRGEDPFPKAGENITNLMFLMQEVMQFVVPENSDISSYADLKGKKVITADRGSSGEFMFKQILEAYGLTYGDLGSVYHTSFSDATTLMKDNRADAWVLSTSLPASTVLDLASSRDIKLVSMDDKEMIEKIAEINPAYVAREIPAGSYDFMDESITAITTSLHLAIDEEMPEDLVYEMAKAICENVEELGDVHKEYKKLTPEKVAQDIGVPFHPGAEKYYKDAGLIDN